MSNNSWKQYGGISKMDNFNTINASTIIADQFISRSVRPQYQLLNGTFEVTDNVIAGKSIHADIDMFSNRDIYANNKLFFGNNNFARDNLDLPTLTDVQKITHAYLYGNDTNIGINTILPKTIFNITGTIGSITDILTVESKNVLIRNIIAQNKNQHGIVVDADDASSNIMFYNDVSTNSINVPDAMIKYQSGGILTTQTTDLILSTAKVIQHDSSGGTLLMNSVGTSLTSSGYLDVDISGQIIFNTDTGFQVDSANDFIVNCSGTILSFNDISSNINTTGNILFTSTGPDGLGGNIVLDSSGGVIEFNSGDIKLNTLLKFSPPERGVSNELLHNETVTIYDNDNTQFLPNVYNDPTILTGNSTTFIGKDTSANTFIFMNPATRKDGGAIGGGMAPHDSSRAMTVIGTTDSLGNYIPSQMTISGINKHKYISTVGINTHKPRTEDYVLDVNGPMHLGNGEINTIADNTYEVTYMNFSKTDPGYGVALGSPSTSTGVGLNTTDALLTSDAVLTGTITDGAYTGLQTTSLRPSGGSSGSGAVITIVALENEITSITVTSSGNGYAVGDTITVTADTTDLVFTLNAGDIVDVAEYNQLLLYTNDGGKHWNTSDIFSSAGELNTDSAVIMRYIDVFDDSYSAIAGSGGNLFLSNNSGQTWYKLQLQGVANTVDYKTINIVEYTNVSNTHRIFISYTLGNSTGIYYFDCVLSTLFNTTTIEIAEADRQNTTTISDTYDYAIHSASSTYGRIYYAGNGGSFSYDINNNASALKLEYNATNYNNIYAFGDGDDHAIAVSTTGISYTTNGSSWNHKTFAELGLSTMVLNSVFIQSLSNAIAVGSQGEFIYSTDWQNGVWQMVPDNLLNSSGMRDRIRGPENNLKSISMPDANTMIIADTITPFISNADFTQTQLGYSKIQYCFLPNLFNRDNNTVFDVSGNSMFDGHITGQATLVINDGNPNTFTVSNDAVNANTKAITLTTTDALTLTDGSVNFIMDGIGATSLRGATTFDLDASGIISINSTDGDINIGNDTILVDQAINIGTGESARTITVGNATGTTKLDINAGTDGIDISSNGHLSIDASGHLSIDAGSESNSQSMDIGKKTHIIEIGKTDERTVIEPIINQLYNDFDSVINIGVSDPITNPGTEDASRVLINIGNYKQNALEGERKSNIINIGGGKDILSLGGTITYSSTEISTSKNKGFQINESHPLHDGIEAYINQAGTTPDMTNIVNTDGIYSYTFTNPAFNAYLLNTGSVNNSDSIEAYIIANSPNHNMTGIADAGGAYTYTVFNPDLEAYIVGTYKPYNTGAGSGIRVTDNLDRDAGYLVVSDDRNGWSMKPTKYGSNSLKIDVNSLILRDDNGYVDGTDVSGIHDIKNGIVMLTKTDSEPTNYKLSVQQIDISNILIRDSNNSTLSKQFVNTELVVQNDVSFNKDLSVGGDVYIEGELRATSTVSSYIINTTVTDYEFILTQDMSLGGILFVGGDASFNANMDISGNVAIGKHNPIVTLDISANDAIRIPVGTTIQRPIFNNTAGYLQITGGTVTTESAQLTTSDISGYIGSIRYNETNKQFEGFGPGDSWGSLGGVVNVAQNTKIIAESAPAETNNQLQFFTANTGSIVGALSTGTASHPHDLVTSVSNSLTEVITLGTYTGLTPTTTGSGTGAILTIVAETDLITSVIVTDAGSGYAVGDKISVTAVDLQSAGRSTDLDITLTANDIVNNAAERMRIDSNGYIGIGTTTPQSKLDVEGSVRIGSGYSGNNTITTNPANGMIIEGNVGIGTSNPQTNLDISNNIFFDVSHNTDSTTYTNIITGANAYDDDGGNLRLKGGGEGSNNYIDINSLITPLILKTGVDDLLNSISVTTGTDINNDVAGGTGYRLQKWDFVNNQAVLPVNNSAIINFSYHYPTTTITSITVTNTGSGYAIGDTCLIVTSNSDQYFNSHKITLTAEHFDGGDNSSINLVTTNTTRVHVNDTGKVGIGTNSPNVILDINGTDAIRLPVGIGSERPIQNGATDAEVNKYIGSIRYHSGNQQFEGFGPGNAWGSLGGVVNVAQNTKIIAESSPAATNNQLQFFTAPKVGSLNIKENHFLNKINNLSEPITGVQDTYYEDLPVTGSGSGSGAILKFKGNATGITHIEVTTPWSNPSLPGFPGYTKGDVLTVTADNFTASGRTTDIVFTLTENGELNSNVNHFINKIGSLADDITVGTYDNLSISGGSGRGAKLKIVAITDNITEVTVTTPGNHYSEGDILTVDKDDIPGRTTDLEFTLALIDSDYESDIYLNPNKTTIGPMAERMIVDSNGYVGIGTTTPQSKLHVTGGDALINGITVGRGAGDISSNIALGVNALQNVSHNNPPAGDRNVAIGYESLISCYGGRQNVAIGYQSLNNCNEGIQNLALGHTAGHNIINGNYNTFIGPGAGGVDDISFGTAIGTSTQVDHNFSTVIGAFSKSTKENQIVLGGANSGYIPGFPEVYIPGNVGIGTTSPQSKLDVEGGVRIGSTYSGNTTITTDPANGMIVEGNVGIGTNTPESGYKLDVAGSVHLSDNLKIGEKWVFSHDASDNLYLQHYSNNSSTIYLKNTIAVTDVRSGGMKTHLELDGDIIIKPNSIDAGIVSQTSNIQLWATFNADAIDGAVRRAADITGGFAPTTVVPNYSGTWGNEFLSFAVGGQMVDTAPNTERMRITTVGVGIGTSTPVTALDVNGMIRSTDVTHNTHIELSSGYLNGDKIAHIDFACNNADYDGRIICTGGTVGETNKGTGTMQYEGSLHTFTGNVGIGMLPSTSNALDIFKDMGSVTVTSMALKAHITDSNQAETGIRVGEKIITGAAVEYIPFRVFSNGGERVRIDKDGRLKVNSTAMVGEVYNNNYLHFATSSSYGGGSASYIDFVTNGTNNNYRARIIGYGGPTDNTGLGTGVGILRFEAEQYHFLTGAVGINTETPTAGIYLDVNGAVQGASFNASSDRRLKTDILGLPNALDLVNQLRGVSFQWKKTPGKKIFGVIAQEVEDIIPELVHTNETENEDGFKQKSIHYDGITPYLIEAIKTLTHQQTELKQEVETLKQENNLLKEKMDKYDALFEQLLNK